MTTVTSVTTNPTTQAPTATGTTATTGAAPTGVASTATTMSSGAPAPVSLNFCERIGKAFSEAINWIRNNILAKIPCFEWLATNRSTTTAATSTATTALQ